MKTIRLVLRTALLAPAVLGLAACASTESPEPSSGYDLDWPPDSPTWRPDPPLPGTTYPRTMPRN